jgi:hypothetical protein
MSIRIHFIVEGQTEETFVNRTLIPHLACYSIWGYARRVMTSKKQYYTYRGGLNSYSLAKNDISLWMKEDNNNDAFFTTMFDLYAIPEDFPEFISSRKIVNPDLRVKYLEDALYADINHQRFIPYIQLHEFEALILADPQKLDCEFLDHSKAISTLVEMVNGFDSPEYINDGEETAPSKRIIKEIPEYEGMKVSAGPIVTEKIGLANIRKKCNHFNQWLLRIEALGKS